MKNLLSLIMFLFVCVFLRPDFLPAQNLNVMETFEVPAGSQLFYAVSAKGKTYGFKITVKASSSSKESVFEWETDRWGGDKKGKVILEKKARASATEVLNAFYPNQTKTYSTQTALWVSKRIYNALTESWGTEITIGEIRGLFSCVQRDIYAVSLDEEPVYVPCISATTPNGGSICIMDSRENPIILSISMGFEMELMTAYSDNETSPLLSKAGR